MMPTGIRARRYALLAGKALVLVLLLVSPRAAYAPKEIVHRSKDSKRPKVPKNVVRAEPVRVPVADRQTLGPGLGHGDAAVDRHEAEFAAHPRTEPLPRKAFTQLTKPDYLKSHSPGTRPPLHAPPA